LPPQWVLSSAANPAATAPGPLSRSERQVLDAFVRAWQACDIPALAALLRDAVADGQIATITGFPDPALFPIFGLPLTRH
jgi:hypothetical protein